MENRGYRDDVEYIPLVATGQSRLSHRQKFFTKGSRSAFRVVFLAVSLAVGSLLGGKIHQAPPLTILDNFHNM
jgi:hypothetical protein